MPPESQWQVLCGFKRAQSRVHVPVTPQQPQQPPPAPVTMPESEGAHEEPPVGEISADPPHSDVCDHDQFADPSQDLPALWRSTRVRRPIDRLAFTTQLSRRYHDEDELFSFQALCPMGTWREPDPLLAMAASNNPDIMYLHEAMREPDRKEFLRAMVKEVKAQMENGNFTIIRRDAAPAGAQILPAVWAMRRKRHIKTREVYKWKARLNIDGSRMIQGVHYDESYAPVATWGSIRFLLALVLKHGWHTKQIDFVAAYTQAPVERELYMEIPKGFLVSEGGKSTDYIMRVERNIYGQKQAGRVWNHFLA